jgi:anti-sigma regulatory factor (Ser/Thr protein kinase)
MSQVEEAPSAASAFRHEALFYAGEDEFIAGTVPFIVDGLERDEPVLVVVNAPKIAALRHALNGAAHDVRFADMAEIGRNPARIIPAWREFVNANGGGTRRLRGVGEPISSDRSEAALTECHRHESLLNLAFADSGDWWLLCPYDTADLPVDVVDEARRTHPFVFEAGRHQTSPCARDLTEVGAPFEDPLPDPPSGTPAFAFDAGGLPAVRLLVRELGEKARLDAARVGDLVLAADEVASNSVRHGGGRGILRIWLDPEAVVCDVRDGGRLDDPMVGRRRPRPEQAGGRGLWMANQLCELLQIRSSNAGTTVRLHVERG